MQSVPVGTQREHGIEIEASYHNDKTRVTISHAYTKLLGFELEPNQTSYISAKPYGHGDDLTNWSNHITKLTAQHKLDDKWTINSSLRIYWGFPGMKAFDEYYPYSGMSASYPDYPIIEEGWKRAYRGSYFLDLGLQYQPNKDLTIGVTGYNLLGVFNKDFNKRNYIPGNGDFRDHAPAVGVSLTYKF
jgi:iron complex outermembrane receptor protein